MTTFTQLPMTNASLSSPVDPRPCYTQKCFSSRPAAGSNPVWRPFQTPSTTNASRHGRSSARRQNSIWCQAVSAPPKPVSKSQTGSGGHLLAHTDHPIRNKREQKGPKILIAGAGIGGLVLAVGLLKRGFDVKVFEKNITAIRGEGKYRGPIQVSGSESSLAHNFLLTKQQSIDKPFNPLQVQSNALAALEAIDKDMADKILAEGCITGDRINGLVDGATGKWYRLSACFNCPWLLIDDAALTLRAQCIYLRVHVLITEMLLQVRQIRHFPPSS